MADNIVWDDEKSGIVWDDEKPATSGYGLTDKPGIAEQFLGGAKHAWDRAAAGLESLVPGGRDLSQALGQPDMQQLVKQGGQFVKETGPASTVGQIAGDIALSAAPAIKTFQAIKAIAPLRARAAAAIAGEAGVNAGYGALTADEGKGGEGAAWGAGGTVGGHALGRALGVVRQGAKPTDSARIMEEAGITLTPGQRAPENGWLRNADNALARTPYVGSPLRSRMDESVAGFQQATRDAALPPKANPPALHIDDLTKRFNDAYARVLANKEVAGSAPEVADKLSLNTLTKDVLNSPEAAGLSQANKMKLANWSHDLYDSNLLLNTFDLPAETYHAMEVQMKQTAAQYLKSSNAEEQILGRAMRKFTDDFKEAWRSGLNPVDQTTLRGIDAAYAKFSPIRKAASVGNSTLVTPEAYSPTQLLQALRQGDRTPTRSKFLAGNMPQQELANAAQLTVGSRTHQPDTAAKLLTALGAGSGFVTGMHALPIAAGTLGAVYGTKPGQALARGTQRALTSDELAIAADLLRRSATPALAGGRKKDD